MNAALLPVPAPALVAAEGTREIHVYCCDIDVGLCGTDISALPVLADGVPATCVVCADLDGGPCSPTCPSPSEVER